MLAPNLRHVAGGAETPGTSGRPPRSTSPSPRPSWSSWRRSPRHTHPSSFLSSRWPGANRQVVPALFEIPALFPRPGFPAFFRKQASIVPALFEIPALFPRPGFHALFSAFLPSKIVPASLSQSNELTRAPPEFIGGVHIGARALHVLNLIWFSNISCLSQWGGKECNFLVQMISTCHRYVWSKGGGRHPVDTMHLHSLFFPKFFPPLRQFVSPQVSPAGFSKFFLLPWFIVRFKSLLQNFSKMGYCPHFLFALMSPFWNFRSPSRSVIRILDEHSGSFFLELSNNFVVKILKLFIRMRIRIRDPGIFLSMDPGSGINIPDPQHWASLGKCQNTNCNRFKIILFSDRNRYWYSNIRCVITGYSIIIHLSVLQEQMARSPPSPSPLLLSTLPSLSPSPNILKTVLDEEKS